MGIDSRSDTISKRRENPHLVLNSFHLSGCCKSFWWVLSISSLTSANAALAFSRVWCACSLSVSFKQRSSICCNRFSHSIWGPLSLKKAYTQKPGIRTTCSTQKLHEVKQSYFCNKIPIMLCIQVNESNNKANNFYAEILSPCALSLVSHCPCLAGSDSLGPVQLHTPAEKPSDDCAPPPLSDAGGGMGFLSVHPENRNKAIRHNILQFLYVLTLCYWLLLMCLVPMKILTLV